MIPSLPSSVDHVLNSAGQPLEAATRQFMEPRFGHDFGRIRIHTDAPTAKAAAELGADAFTVGHHVAFAHGRFQPGASHTRRLMAHELTHTIQQAGTSPYIALSPAKNDGAFLGTDRNSREILVKRDLGAIDG